MARSIAMTTDTCRQPGDGAGFGAHRCHPHQRLGHGSPRLWRRIAGKLLPLRKYLFQGHTILQLLNIEDSQVFESAIVNVAILLVQKAQCKRGKSVLVTNTPCNTFDFSDYVHASSFKIDNASFGGPFWSLAPQQVLLLKRKIEQAGVTLERLQIKIRLGIATGANEAFILDESQRNAFLTKNKRNGELIKPILRGRDIDRYAYTHKGSYVLLTKNGVNVQRDYPDIYAHLDSFGPEFKRRGAKGEHWYNLRACAFFDDFAKEKIVWIELTDDGRFALSSDGIYLVNSAYFLLPPSGINAKYLLAVLNSRLMKFYLGLIAETSGMGTTRWINNYVKEFPIVTAPAEREKVILSLVARILATKERQTSADATALERAVDQQVYALYGLTPEEIKIVEEAAK